MAHKKILSAVLSIILLGLSMPGNITIAQGDKTQRTVYLHAQGENPQESSEVSTVYMGEQTDVYLAVDNPNKGLYENGEHKEPQYDMNGYTVKIYFDPAYFELASDNLSEPIDYTVPGRGIGTSDTGSEDVGGAEIELPETVGYYAYRHGSKKQVINGKTYNSAYLTVFFSGGYISQKNNSQKWYNLCKLPLKPLRTGSTDVFIDTSGSDEYSLELFAKNQSGNLSEQTFMYNTVNGGYHHIIIKDKAKPAVPVPNPAAGSYTEKQTVELTAESGCDIYYSIDGKGTFEKFVLPIDIEASTTITCYAKRISDGKTSDTVSYSYEILPKAPYLFDSGKSLIPNIYSEYNAFSVYVSDKNIFGPIDDGSEIFYTFSDASADEIAEDTDPENGWVKVSKLTQSIEITKKRTLRLITGKMGEFSDVSLYYLGVKPGKVTSSHPSDTYGEKIDITLSCSTIGGKIYYTTDGSDPISNGMEYAGPITVAKDTTLRAVSKYDGEHGDVVSFHYIFNYYDDYGVDAFYSSGVYEGSVNVTLTPNNPENKVKYSTNGENTWIDCTGVINIDKDTDIFAKAVDRNGNEGGIYKFTYKIKPLPPAFAPESTQFTNSDKITIYCPESTNENTDRFELYYTTDGSDPSESSTRIKADDSSDSAIIDITKYTVISAVVRKDGSTYSNVVKHSYDIVSKKPVNPITSLVPGNYTRKIGDDKGFETQFMPVPAGTEIYYTISYNGEFVSDPVPNTAGTKKYDGIPIKVRGKTLIKAVAVNIFGVKSDVGIFEYTVVPEAPKSAPSAVIGSSRLPVVPVSAVKESKIKYEINGFTNEFICNDGNFYLDTSTGSAYEDKACTAILGTQSGGSINSPAVLNISSELDGVKSYPSQYSYTLSNDPDTLAPPYADKETGEYKEIKADEENNLLYIKLYSLNSGDKIQYRIDNAAEWTQYDGREIKINKDTTLQLRSVKNGSYSSVSSYVYQFVPLAPVITLPSGRYSKTPVQTTEIKLDECAPSDKHYTIWYRSNGDTKDFRYNNQEREITHTMSFKAYVLNEDTGKVSENTIHYYIIESDSASSGRVYIANPYDAERISADVLDTGEYANGIKLLTQNNNAKIHYYYSYKKIGSADTITTNTLIYDNAAPIMVNSSMDFIRITAWLEDENGRIGTDEFINTIDFVHLNVPRTSLGSEKVEFEKGTKYKFVNDYPEDKNILLYYTLDGSDPADSDNGSRKLCSGEELELNEAVTVKASYFSACGKCIECRNDNFSACRNGVYGKTGTYKYTVSTVRYTGGGGGGGGSRVVDNTRKYTKDIFENEHQTHIGYISGYPDGRVQPDGHITREEMAAVLYRIKNKQYDKPFSVKGNVFPDIEADRWSVTEIEYMASENVITGYPDGEFKPSRNLTRAEFAALICRFIKLGESDRKNNSDNKNVFSDLPETHWAYGNIMSLYDAGILDGYEDGTVRPENDITRAEVMTVVNELLGRNPSESYVKSLDYNPYSDLKADKWYYVTVLEATVTHDYLLDDKGIEVKWENCK